MNLNIILPQQEVEKTDIGVWRARQDKNTSFKIQDLFEKIVLINVRK